MPITLRTHNCQPGKPPNLVKWLARLVTTHPGRRLSVNTAVARTNRRYSQSGRLIPARVPVDERPGIAEPARFRLLHHAHLILTEGTSLRLAEATAGQGVTPLT